MKKILIILFVLFAISNSFEAQNSIAYQVDDVDISGHKLEMLSNGLKQNSEKSIMFKNQTKFVFDDTKNKKSYGTRGALIGGLIGGGIGFAVGIPFALICTLGDAIGSNNGNCGGTLLATTLIGAGVGAAIGAGIGSTISN